jgi:hypothetical protein
MTLVNFFKEYSKSLRKLKLYKILEKIYSNKDDKK